ncbi:hypothetical protein BD769DRAFT_118691 [Suillus cothurnatus]|nr:hypothetical protein BD769DRAFT_118691 [Suillus cothurnatus]
MVIISNILHSLTLISTHLSNMTAVSNDPSWWPVINFNIFLSYWSAAAGVVVVYDWVLTLGQEIELIWRQRWSLMTVLYLVIRYIGIPFSVANLLISIPYVSLTDAVGNIFDYAISWTNLVIPAMLGVIMIARLHAMYQRSRIMLIFLVIVFLAVNIACGVIVSITLRNTVGEELILSGTYMCNFEYDGADTHMMSVIQALITAWEVLALCFSVWIAVKHFRDLRQLGPSTGLAIGDCFRVLIKSHVLYFASFVSVSIVQFIYISPEFFNSISMGTQIFYGALQILWAVQVFMLGPRLILSVREYYAKLVVDSDAETSMNSVVFQERVHIQTNSTV